MSKIIAVCGSPNSGKTTAAMKLAQEIYYQNKATVMYLSPDTRVPGMAYLFPNGKDQELYSLGVALDKTDICKEDILRQTVSVKTMQNIGFLGFKLGENRYSYPQPTEDKITQFFSVLRECAEYVVVDCTCDPDDLISAVAKRDCDVAVQLHTPDMRCIAYYASCVNQFVTVAGKALKVLNVMDNDIYVPINETETHFHGMDFKLPYEKNLKHQMITGTISERLGACKYRAEIEKMVKAVL